MNKKAFFILFPISALVFFIWMFLNQEAPPISEEQKKHTLEQTLGRSIKQEKIIPQGEQNYQGKFFSLDYPAYTQLYNRENTNISANKNLRERLRLDSEEPKFRFVVMVESADSSTVLEELSGVRMRRQDKLYQELPITINGVSGTLFVKTSAGVEHSSFFLINGKSYSFSITGVDENELEKVYGEIM